MQDRKQADFALDSYLARIGLDARPGADAEGLRQLQRAHRRTVPFENLDIPLGRAISLEPGAQFAKLVTARRGGYCFEHNPLFLRALHALGFDARLLLARVWLMAEDVPPRTHCLILVMLDGAPWIADAGFGGSYSPPMPLREGDVVTAPDGTRHRLTIDPVQGWMLERAGDPAATDGRAHDHDGWQPQYSFTLDRVEPVDLELSNHWTSTRPHTRFTTHRIASIALEDGFASLFDGMLTVTRGGVAERRTLSDGESYREALRNLFGIALSPDEAARIASL